MPKRNWAEANSTSPNSLSRETPKLPPSPARIRSYIQDGYQPSPSRGVSAEGSPDKSQEYTPNIATIPNVGIMNGSSSSSTQRLPSISRKVKACAACRKQKVQHNLSSWGHVGLIWQIKCLMRPEDSPPCQRCRERGLSCRLNKSLQTLMSEDSKWKASVTRDIVHIHTSLQQVLQSLCLPDMPTLHITNQENAVIFDHDNPDDDGEQSCDSTPKLSPMTEHVAQIPIESLYQITGLKSLCSQDSVTDEQKRICKQLRDTDFISRGQISLQDADQLATYYVTHLDPYFYNMTAQYGSLDDFRRRSPTLTAAVLTVAALHDISAKPELYLLCSKEFKRLVANAMFEPKIDIEYLRALVVGSYWLSDIGWTLSGYAIRRASELHLKSCYYQITDSLEHPSKYSQEQMQDARDGLRLLYLLYICDHHLSILYGRASIMRDNDHYILGYENYLACSVASGLDQRLASQVSLLLLVSKIRESLGPEDDTGIPLPESMLPKIKTFEIDLQNWVLRWSSTDNTNKDIDTFPTKGTYIHHYFSKIYLSAYVFRGLPTISSSQTPVIPASFVETAAGAVSAAINIVNIILGDFEVQVGLANVPHYFYGMIAFACVFLVKAATKHSGQLLIDQHEVRVLIDRLSTQLSATRVGHGHVIHRMAGGLRKMADSLVPSGSQQLPSAEVDRLVPRTRSMDYRPVRTAVPDAVNSTSFHQYPAIESMDVGYGASHLGFGMPFFDFEGTNLDNAPGMFPF